MFPGIELPETDDKKICLINIVNLCRHYLEFNVDIAPLAQRVWENPSTALTNEKKKLTKSKKQLRARIFKYEEQRKELIRVVRLYKIVHEYPLLR